MFWCLKEGCNVVYGKNGACIYNLNNCKVYSMDIDESKMLYDIEHGKSIFEIKECYDCKLVDSVIKKLECAEILMTSSQFYPKEIFRDGKCMVSRLEKQYRLSTCYLELGFTCNNGCSYCSANRLFGCYSCKTTVSKNCFNFGFYITVIDALKELGCKNFILYGGDLITNFIHVKSIIDYLKPDAQVGIVISIDNPLDNSIDNYLNQNNIIKFINVDYNKRELYTYSADYKTFYNFNVKLNDEREELKELTKFDKKAIKYNISYYADKYEKISYSKFPQIKLTSKSFTMVDEINLCLYGKIVIKSDKKVYPCVNSFKPIGSINENIRSNLEKSFKLLFEYWEGTYKNYINCSSCKYKKSCRNCLTFHENFGCDKKKNCLDM